MKVVHNLICSHREAYDSDASVGQSLAKRLSVLDGIKDKFKAKISESSAAKMLRNANCKSTENVANGLIS